jgi:hypothetical protein
MTLLSKSARSCHRKNGRVKSQGDLADRQSLCQDFSTWTVYAFLRTVITSRHKCSSFRQKLYSLTDVEVRSLKSTAGGFLPQGLRELSPASFLASVALAAPAILLAYGQV